MRVPVEIEIEGYGTVLMHSAITMLSYSEIDTSLPPREFTIHLLRDLIYSPRLTLNEIREWDDNVIKNVVKIWGEKKQDERWQFPNDDTVFEEFQQIFEILRQEAYRSMLDTFKQAYAPIIEQQAKISQQIAESLQPNIQAIQDSLNAMVKPVVESFQQSISAMIDTQRLAIPSVNLFKILPDFSKFAERLAVYEPAARTLDESGYRFLFRDMSLADIANFLGIEQVDKRVRNAVITNKLLTMIRQTEFREELHQCFSESTTQTKRWHIIEQALSAHLERKYALSIPVLLTQVEGMMTDALVLNGLVIGENGKFYAKENGKAKLNKNDKKIELRGIGEKLNNAELRDDTRLQDLSEFITTNLVPERNAILHGNNIKYDRAKLSVELVLNIYVLIAAFVAFESGN